MFSLYRTIKLVNYPIDNITISQLHDLIKYNDQKELIGEIRNLRKSGMVKEYKELKKQLRVVTPFSTSTSKNQNSCTSLSNYIYVDIDNLEDAESTKADIINKYGHLITLMCVSCSGSGLTLLLKVKYNNILTEMIEGLGLAINHVKQLLPGYKYDDSTKDLARGLFISYDKEVYYNENADTIELPHFSDEEIKKYVESNTKKKKGSVKSSPVTNNLNIDEVLSVLKLQTEVINENPIVDLQYVDNYAKVYIPKLITDGTKRSVYYAILCNLMYINPGVPDIYFISFINFINNTYAKPKMEYKEMIMHINSIIRQVKAGTMDLNTVVTTSVKKIHFNKDSGLSPDEKRKIANQMNGKMKSNESIIKIIAAKKGLSEQGKKVTKVAVAEISGLGIATVKRNWDKEITDIYSAIEEVNNNTVVVKNIDEVMNEEIAEQWAAAGPIVKTEAELLSDELTQDWSMDNIEPIDITTYDRPRVIEFEKPRREDISNDDLFIDWM